MGYSVVTKVVTAASSYDLTDLATVKDELGLGAADTSDDTWLGRAITQVSKSIAKHTKRVFPVETVQDVFDVQQDPYPYQTPGGFAQLELTRWPVVDVTSVVQTVALNTTQALTEDVDFRVDPESGRLLRLNPFTGVGSIWEALPVTVQYSAGYETVPEDLVEICLRLITARYQAKDRDPNLMQEDTPGVGTRRWWVGGSPGQKGPFPPDIEAALDGYRMPVVV